MANQADKLRDLFKGRQKKNIRPASDKIRIIAVASGKGGVGKTSLTVNLAIALARAGKKVMILDADLGMANVDIMMGLTPRYTLHDVIQGHRAISDIVLDGLEGVKIVPGCSGIFEAVSIQRIRREALMAELEYYSRDMDYVLVDTGAGISKTVLGFVASADDVIVVVTPEPTSIADGYGIIKIVSRFRLHKKVFLVVNMANNVQEAEETARKIEIVANNYLDISIKRLGVIYADPSVKKSIKEMTPFIIKYPRSQAAFSVERIARNIIEDKIGFNGGSLNFAQKVINLWR
jgi:flagellar biosynthesis protein FlhG